VTTLRKVAEVDPLALPPPPGSKATPLGGLLVTGGDISPDGKRLVICTYGPAYEWKIPNGDVAAALGTKPAVLLLPRAGQREAIAYSRDGRSLLTSSEGKHAPVHELRP